MNDNRIGQNFKIIADPRWESTQADLQAQHDFLMSVRDKLTETHQAIEDIRNIREQMNTVVDKVKGNEAMHEIVDKAKAIDQKMTVIEQELYQTKNRSGQDPLNFPIKLNNKLANVGSQVGYGHFKPTQQAIDFKDEIIEKIDEQLQEFKKVINQEVPEFNRMVQEKNVSSVSLKDTPQPVNP